MKQRSLKRPSHTSGFLLYVFLLTILFAGIVAGVAFMTPGGEVIGVTVSLFCALAFGVVIGASGCGKVK